MSDFDVVIVGAGAAGLAAASVLAQSGRSVCVIEARERIGGRIFTRIEPNLPVPIELGAELVHGRSEVTMKWVRRANSALIDLPDNRQTRRAGAMREGDDLFEALKKGLKRTPRPKRDLPFKNFLDGPARRTLSPELRRFARALVEGFDAADATRVSTLEILNEWRGSAAADAPTFRPLGGYGAIMQALAATLPTESVHLRLHTVVREVRWSAKRVIVEATRHGERVQITARRAIVTLPLGVLQLPAKSSHAVHFAPTLKEKRNSFAHLGVGPVIKVNLRFQHALWEKLDNGRFCDTSFFHAPSAVFPTLWSALPMRVPLLVLWAGGPNAERLSNKSPAQILEAALDSTELVFGKRANVRDQLQSWFFHNWQTDPFACGAYSFVLAGGSSARREFAKPIKNTLFFAGEATDDGGEAATVAGALQSGERAARRIIEIE